MLTPAARDQIALGDTTVTFLPDGEVHLDASVLFPPSADEGWGEYAPYLDPDGRLPLSVGAFLVRTRTHQVLVDLGLGPVAFELDGLATFRGGDLLDSLAAEGVAPADVDAVVFTHLHHDHVGWTTDGGGLTFPRARHLVAPAEWDHWNGSDSPVGPDPAAVQKPLAAIVEPLAALPGLTPVPTPGHTPGHTSLLVTDPGTDERVLVLGDTMHTQAQVARTGWSFRFDVDPAAGMAAREGLLRRFTDGRTTIAGGHFAGSVFGRFLPPDNGYRWSR